jgi:hypothetical protein
VASAVTEKWMDDDGEHAVSPSSAQWAKEMPNACGTRLLPATRSPPVVSACLPCACVCCLSVCVCGNRRPSCVSAARPLFAGAAERRARERARRRAGQSRAEDTGGQGGSVLLALWPRRRLAACLRGCACLGVLGVAGCRSTALLHAALLRRARHTTGQAWHRQGAQRHRFQHATCEQFGRVTTEAEHPRRGSAPLHS